VKFAIANPYDGIPPVETGTILFSSHGMPSSFRSHNGMPSYRQKLCGIPSGFISSTTPQQTEFRHGWCLLVSTSTFDHFHGQVDVGRESDSALAAKVDSNAAIAPQSSLTRNTPCTAAADNMEVAMVTGIGTPAACNAPETP
jgi:hypothetical protein